MFFFLESNTPKWTLRNCLCRNLQARQPSCNQLLCAYLILFCTLDLIFSHAAGNTHCLWCSNKNGMICSWWNNYLILSFASYWEKFAASLCQTCGSLVKMVMILQHLVQALQLELISVSWQGPIPYRPQNTSATKHDHIGHKVYHIGHNHIGHKAWPYRPQGIWGGFCRMVLLSVSQLFLGLVPHVIDEKKAH